VIREDYSLSSWLPVSLVDTPVSFIGNDETTFFSLPALRVSDSPLRRYTFFSGDYSLFPEARHSPQLRLDFRADEDPPLSLRTYSRYASEGPRRCKHIHISWLQ